MGLGLCHLQQGRAPDHAELSSGESTAHVTPNISVSNRQRMVRVDAAKLRDFAQRALVACLERPRRTSSRLASLEEVEAAPVSDKRIAEIHQRFMNDPTPTDVITFQHGEILISVETAKRQARQFGTTLDHELRL